MKDEFLLRVKDLAVHYRTAAGPVQAVDGIDFDIRPGEALGLVGESGCGKTTSAKAMLKLLPPNGFIPRGSIELSGRDIAPYSEDQMRALRWSEIAWVSQAAMNALDPVYRIGDQITEAMQAHIQISRQDAWAHGETLFRAVGIDPARLRAYPHEMSGGMKQRAVIAMAMALNPKLVIADEPTTALDVVTQAQILARLGKLRREHGMALLFITHDISVVVQTCDRVAVMYGGKVMETGPVRDVFRHPVHPYTMGLTNAFPTLEGAQRELISIPGTPPNLLHPPQGCRFAQRCPFATELCQHEEPALQKRDGDRAVACHYPDQAPEFRLRSSREQTWADVASRLGETMERRQQRDDTLASQRLFSVQGLKRHFDVPAPLFSKQESRKVHAVDGVDFDLYEGEILGLAGESGSGKTTTAEVLVRLQEASAGTISFADLDIAALKGAELKAFRRRAQMVFQDPYQTLNPRFTIGSIVAEPLTIHKIASADALQEKVIQALERAGLKPAQTYLDRYPHELSGGQRQRVAIARAIVLEPSFIVADEPVSMLDVSIRAGVLNLMRQFRDDLGISFVYVSHDLPTIRYVADRTAIMYLGESVEIGPTEVVIAQRKHPYTQLLLEASPEPDPDVVKHPVEAAGEIPSAIEPPNGCRFHTRCAQALPQCGWEGRDVAAALAAYRLELGELDGLGSDVRIDGLNARIAYHGDVEQAKSCLQKVLAYKHAALAMAAHIEVENSDLLLRFDTVASPKRRAIADNHDVACFLYPS